MRRVMGLSNRRRAQRGLTLMELLLASTLGLLVMFAFGGVDMGRVLLLDQVRQDSQFHTNLTYALWHMTKHLEVADRIALGPADNLLFRVPRFTGLPNTTAAVDNAANYVWNQYRLVPGTNGLDNIMFYEQIPGGCGRPQLLSGNILSLAFEQPDEISAPPGAVGPDNNVLRMTIQGREDQQIATSRRLTVQGQVIMRARAYTNDLTGLTRASVPPGGC